MKEADSSIILKLLDYQVITTEEVKKYFFPNGMESSSIADYKPTCVRVEQARRNAEILLKAILSPNISNSGIEKLIKKELESNLEIMKEVKDI